ncbi:hypothetical protein RBB78_03555 [Tunturiibacter empetritectus]|uniref:hypothetical protein n=1 Tax=Tunturiibacter empetritectus TaxID=3069691 RepID=UPI003D9B0AD5
MGRARICRPLYSIKTGCLVSGELKFRIEVQDEMQDKKLLSLQGSESIHGIETFVCTLRLHFH